MRNAQVTMFIMIGMILLVFAALFFYATELVQKRVEVRVVEASSTKELVEHCLGVVAEDALLVIGRQGGVARLTGSYFEPLNTSYLFDEGENKVPDTDAVAQELSDYSEEHLGLCIDGFKVLEKKGITAVEKGPLKVTTLIAEKDVRFSIDWQLEERKGGVVTTPEFVPAQKAVRLKEILQLASDLVESEQTNEGLFDLDVPCNLDVLHFPLEKTLVTIITDQQFLIQNKPYRFVFAHRRQDV